jgi:hypothetical protein
MVGHPLRPALAAAIAVVICVLLPAGAAAKPVQGMYESCSPAEPECMTRLAEMRGAGITRVINYMAWRGTPEQRQRYADAAARLGVGLVWPIDRRWSRPEIESGVQEVRYHPATWGYYVDEELPPALAPELQARSDVVRAADPNHPRMYIAWGGSDLAQTLSPFAPAVEAIGVDWYPVGLGSVRTPVSSTEATVRTADRLNGDRQTVAVLQAFSWAQFPKEAPYDSTDPFPTARQMRRQRDFARAGGARVMFWFDYYYLRPPGSSDYSHLNDLAWAIGAPYHHRQVR